MIVEAILRRDTVLAIFQIVQKLCSRLFTKGALSIVVLRFVGRRGAGVKRVEALGGVIQLFQDWRRMC